MHSRGIMTFILFDDICNYHDVACLDTVYLTKTFSLCTHAHRCYFFSLFSLFGREVWAFADIVARHCYN